MSTDLDIAVIGAGVSGLHTACKLRDAGRDVQVFEGAGRVGGRMRTLRQDGWIIDEGAEAIATHGFPTTWSLIDRLGLTAADVPRIPGTIAIWRHGRPHGNVGRARGLLTGLGLSPRARLQLLRFTSDGIRARRSFDPDRPEATPLGETTVEKLADRYGRELLDWLLQPLITGFTGWYPHRSAAGPFIANMLATRSTANWRTYRDGMDTLARRMAAGLAVRTGSSVREVTRWPDGVRITFADGEQLTARAVVLAVPAPLACELYPDMPADERPYLRASTYSVRLRVSFALREPLAIAGNPATYALGISQMHDPALSAITVDHCKNPHRVPPGAGLITALTSPDASRVLIGAPDGEVVREVAGHAEQYLPQLRGSTLFTHVHRFPHGMPEATAESLRLRPAFLRRPIRAVDYAGDWLMQRPSSEGALRSAFLVVPRLLAHTTEASGAIRREAAHD
jgi:oxygen-dependent protoporphyrinogen oxidase